MSKQKSTDIEEKKAKNPTSKEKSEKEKKEKKTKKKSEEKSEEKQKKPKKSKKEEKEGKTKKHTKKEEVFESPSLILPTAKRPRERTSILDEVNDSKRAKTEPVSETAITNFRVSEKNVEMLRKRGIESFFPIQAQTYDLIFDGKDIVGRAQTGSGKTLSFALPVCEKLLARSAEIKQSRFRKPIVICLAPTRELAKQNSEEFERCCGKELDVMTVYGGVPIRDHCFDLKRGCDILVGTPGRIIDLLERKVLLLTNIEYVILDEADEMLNFGFAPDVEKILQEIPSEKEKQTLLFSATMPDWVSSVAKKFLKPNYSQIDIVKTSAQRVPTEVKHLALCCPPQMRATIIGDLLKLYGSDGRVIVFCDTKIEANELSLNANLDCQVIHGDISQSQREMTLKSFKENKFNVLIATDVAARGLDISGIDLIIMCRPSKDPSQYIHRAGRTGRAGKNGTVITFFTKAMTNQLRFLENAVGVTFKRIGAPQKSDMLDAILNRELKALDEIPESNFEAYLEKAKEFVDTNGIVGVAKLFSRICGVNSVDTYSLLSAQKGFVCVHVTTRYEPRSKAFIMNALRPYLQEELGNVKEIALCENGALFDVPEKTANTLIQAKPNGVCLRFEIPTELPENLRDAIPQRSFSAGPSRGPYSGSRNTGSSMSPPPFGARGGFYRGRGAPNRGSFNRGGFSGRGNFNSNYERK